MTTPIQPADDLRKTIEGMHPKQLRQMLAIGQHLTVTETGQHKQLPPQPEFKRGMYQHYNGGMYLAVALVLIEKDLTWAVLYHRVNDPLLWVRPLTEWNEEVEIRGACILTDENIHTEGDCTMHEHENTTRVPRFEFISGK